MNATPIWWLCNTWLCQKERKGRFEIIEELNSESVFSRERNEYMNIVDFKANKAVTERIMCIYMGMTVIL